MTRAEAIAILGPEDAAHAIAVGLEQPPPGPELISLLQRVFNSPECLAPTRPAAPAADERAVAA